jgi:hypothetical protein
MSYLHFLVAAWLFYNWDFPVSAEQWRMWRNGIRDESIYDATRSMMTDPGAYDYNINEALNVETRERFNKLLRLLTVLR